MREGGKTREEKRRVEEGGRRRRRKRVGEERGRQREEVGVRKRLKEEKIRKS